MHSEYRESSENASFFVKHATLAFRDQSFRTSSGHTGKSGMRRSKIGSTSRIPE